LWVELAPMAAATEAKAQQTAQQAQSTEVVAAAPGLRLRPTLAVLASS
jgi:hypothetical protein